MSDLPPPPPSPPAGTLLGGRYRLGALLGRGGMGQVYEAEVDGLRVAIKLSLKGQGQPAETRSRFKLEAEACRKSMSPFVVQFLEHAEDPEWGPFLAMELLEGLDLARFLDTGCLSTPAALRLFSQIALGLQAAHQAGVLHRDIKPSNIFLHQRDGKVTPKLIDFSITDRLRQADDTQTTSLTRRQANTREAATRDYAAPEQLLASAGEGNHRAVGPRADLWSLTATLYEALHGRRYWRFQRDELRENASASNLLRPDERVPPEVFALLQKGLSLDPDLRFASAHDMSERLATLARRPAEQLLTLDELSQARRSPVPFALGVVEPPPSPGATQTSPAQTATPRPPPTSPRPRWVVALVALGGLVAAVRWIAPATVLSTAPRPLAVGPENASSARAAASAEPPLSVTSEPSAATSEPPPAQADSSRTVSSVARPSKRAEPGARATAPPVKPLPSAPLTSPHTEFKGPQPISSFD